MPGYQKEVHPMKICFPVATDAGLESTLYGHFSSAPLYVMIDTDTDGTTAVANCDQAKPHAGCNPFKALINRQLDGVIVGGIGDGFLKMLNLMGLRVYQAQSESVKDNVELFKQNALDELQVQDSELEGMCSSSEGEHHCNHNH
jgi:predicted Fe-Mo cluster-binding NifX family protein